MLVASERFVGLDVRMRYSLFRFASADSLVVRPPVRSNRRTYKMLVMFSFFQRVISELPRPITAKLRHMIGTGVYFIN